jgi:actin-like ATPase involved in cell morphogenesis
LDALKNELEDIELEGSRGEKAVIRGRDIETGLPRSLRITESEHGSSPVISEIVDSVMDVIETPQNDFRYWSEE